MAKNFDQKDDQLVDRTSFYQLLVGKDVFVIGVQLLLFGFFLADVLIGKNYANPGLALLLIPGVGIASIAFAGFRKHMPHFYVVTQFAYYLALLSLLVFIVPVFGIYYIVLLIVMFSTIYWYGFRGLIAALIGSSIIIWLGLITQFESVSADLIWSTARTAVVTLFGAVLFWRMLSSDINERQTLESLRTQARIERDRMHALINSMDAAVIATDEKGVITLYNGATLDLLNTNETLDNQPLKTVLKIIDEDDEKPIDLIADVKSNSSAIRRTDIILQIDEKEQINLNVSVSPVHPSFGQKIGEGYVVTLRDITKEKNLDEERDDFISVTSHELRTPIAITEANLSTALLDKMSKGMKEETKKLLVAAHDNVVFLANLVGDLATLARAEKKVLDIDVAPVDPAEVLKKLKQDYDKDATNKGLEIKIAKLKKMHSILTSELYIHEILQNFMTNAIKYTKEGIITIGAQVGENNSITFWVKDSGIGISKSDQKKLFDKFFRSEDYRTRETGGTGLGLYITRKLTERINGTIHFESELNKGSTFYLHVPPIGAQADDHEKVTKAEIDDLASSL